MTAEAPWVGARAFGPEDVSRFFGRSREITLVAELWQRHRLTVLHGDSGVGKTSLLRAGVLPHLTAGGANVLPIGGAGYQSTLPAPAIPAWNPYSFALLSSWQPAEVPGRTSGRSIRDFLRAKERAGDRFGRTAPTLIAIDQFDQVVRGGPDERLRREFLEELTEAVAGVPSAHLLVSVRTEHLDDVAPVVEAVGEESTFALRPLERDAAIEAVTRPPAGLRMSFEPGVAGRLVDDLGEGGAVEPALLQVTCTELWERASGGVISDRSLPDVDLVLADFCARSLATVTADHDLPTCEIGTWLRRAFITARGDVVAVPWEERPAEMTESVIRAVRDRHLVKLRRRDGGLFLELQHPRLAAAVQRLGEARPADRQDDPADYLRAAELAMSAGELRLARRHAEAATRLGGQEHLRIHAKAQSMLGDIAYAQDRPDTAADHYSAATGLFEMLHDVPAVGHLLAALGRIKQLQGDQAAALKALNTAAVRAPHDVTVQVGLGQAFWQAGRLKAALAVLNELMMREGRIVEAMRMRGEILMDLGDAEAALRDLDRIGPRARPSTRAARALARAMLSRAEVSPQEVVEIVASAPGSGPVLFRAALIRRLHGAGDDARDLAERALLASDPPLTEHQRNAAVEQMRNW